MKKSVLASLLIVPLFFIGTTAFCQDSHKAAAEEMLIVSKVDKVLDPVFDRVTQMMQSQFNKMNVPEDKKPVLEKYNRKIVEMMKKELAWEKIKDDYIRIYTKVYSEKELKDITEFYKSPTGSKMVDRMPQLLQESMALSQKNLQKILPEIMKATSEMQAELGGSE